MADRPLRSLTAAGEASIHRISRPTFGAVERDDNHDKSGRVTVARQWRSHGAADHLTPSIQTRRTPPGSAPRAARRAARPQPA
jgi:hypothetical protein